MAASDAASDWVQPAYEKVVEIIDSGDKSGGGWGHPVTNIAALWTLCPALEIPTNAIDPLTCDQSTCAVVCPDGYIATGKRRTRCRWKKSKGFFWKKQLGGCETCAALTAPAAGITQTCDITGRKKAFCSHTCDNGGTFALATKTPDQIKVKCKCPRAGPMAARVCGWYSVKMGGLVAQADIDALTCNEPVVTTVAVTTTMAVETTTTGNVTIALLGGA